MSKIRKSGAGTIPSGLGHVAGDDAKSIAAQKSAHHLERLAAAASDTIGRRLKHLEKARKSPKGRRARPKPGSKPGQREMRVDRHMAEIWRLIRNLAGRDKHGKVASAPVGQRDPAKTAKLKLQRVIAKLKRELAALEADREQAEEDQPEAVEYYALVSSVMRTLVSHSTSVIRKIG